jgi:TPR repeat protein
MSARVFDKLLSAPAASAARRSSLLGGASSLGGASRFGGALACSLVALALVASEASGQETRRPPNGAQTASAAPAAAGGLAAAGVVAPDAIFRDPRAALRRGMEGYRAGDFVASVSALKYAADGGQPLARWKLGQMYAHGDGVPHDDYKAFQYFSQIVSAYDEDTADPRETQVVSSAFVSVGVYSLNGIANTSVKRNPQRALEMFHYAATNFGDASAQYNLARMYLDGNGVPRNARQAVPWLNYAADKNHAEAQALLGDILFSGAAGMPIRRSLGLMYLTLAREAASDEARHRWIVDLHEKAVSLASDADKQMAHVELGHHLNRRAR